MSEHIIKFVAKISTQGKKQKVIVVPKEFWKDVKKYEGCQVVIEVRTVV